MISFCRKICVDPRVTINLHLRVFFRKENSMYPVTLNVCVTLVNKADVIVISMSMFFLVSSQEEFKNDKSLFRFASDDCDAEKLIRSVAIGYRLYEG